MTDEIQSSKQRRLITIAGPTAVGKTALSLRLASYYSSEILSADSRQFYHELDIGVARPEAEALARVPHHFIADRSIEDHLTAAQYESEALSKMKGLFEKHQVLICAGGSGLYLKALLQGLDQVPDVPEGVVRQLESEWERGGLDALQRELSEKDPLITKSTDLMNHRRVIRALSVVRHTGQPLSAFFANKEERLPFHQTNIVLVRDREELYDRINTRVDVMMERGLLDEARRLYPRRELKALQTVGYQELFDFMDEKCTLAYAVDKIKQHSRNYAKRQLTWFRKQGEWKMITMTDRSEDDVFEEVVHLIPE